LEGWKDQEEGRLGERLSRSVRRPAVAVFASVLLLGSPAYAQDTVRVLSYNIRHGAGMDLQLDLERTAAVIRSLDPHVVLLQEVDSCTARTGGVDQAEALSRLTGLPHFAFGRFMDYDGGAYGMAVLSASPLIEHANHLLPEGEEPRSALAARIRPAEAGPEIVFVGIHFYRTESERFAQARTLVNAIADESAPVLLVGDFNSEPGDPVMRFLGSHLRLPAKPTHDRFTWRADAPDVEIDHVLFRPEDRFHVIDYRVIDEREASDHRPVLMIFTVR
jgi:endonuclease/exonuclease/phosphatase family metal-dependent hydrolase